MRVFALLLLSTLSAQAQTAHVFPMVMECSRLEDAVSIVETNVNQGPRASVVVANKLNKPTPPRMYPACFRRSLYTIPRGTKLTFVRIYHAVEIGTNVLGSVAIFEVAHPFGPPHYMMVVNMEAKGQGI